jgi:hypothetical protein
MVLCLCLFRFFFFVRFVVHLLPFLVLFPLLAVVLFCCHCFTLQNRGGRGVYRGTGVEQRQTSTVSLARDRWTKLTPADDKSAWTVDLKQPLDSDYNIGVITLVATALTSDPEYSSHVMLLVFCDLDSCRTMKNKSNVSQSKRNEYALSSKVDVRRGRALAALFFPAHACRPRFSSFQFFTFTIV